jgi:type VI secretion system protein ImpB
MAKDGSVAPKERVNIKYEASTGDAKEEKELPLKMLMVGDYTQAKDDTPVEDRKPVNVDKDNFNDVMKSQSLKLDFSVPNKISDEPKEGEEIPVKLSFEGLKDFGPESVARQVPELRTLLELRESLAALKGPLGNFPAFRKKIQSLVSDTDKAAQLLKELGGGPEAGGGGESPS